MEGDLDRIATGDSNWIEVLRAFYDPFTDSLEYAYKHMTHAKAETEPAIYKCPECGSRTEYRLGKNGRFLSCTQHPDCKFAATVDRENRPMLIQRVNVQCPEDGSPMVLRSGRFGPFLASVNYPEVKTVVNLDKKKGDQVPVDSRSADRPAVQQMREDPQPPQRQARTMAGLLRVPEMPRPRQVDRT